MARRSDTKPAAIDTTGASLLRAAVLIHRAEVACLDWERGGDADEVARTAALAKNAACVAFEAVVADEPWGDPLGEPETRRGRLAYAGWLVLLAGVDEHGESEDLAISRQLIEGAAQA